MSISSKAVLVVFSIGGIPEPRRQDKKVQREVAKRHKVEEKQVLFQKYLWDPDSPTYVALKQWATKAREENYAYTSAYPQDGARFLKATEILAHKDRMRTLEEEGIALFDEFLGNLPKLKAAAKKALNGMFDESLYPTEKKLRSRFNFEVNFLPVPDSGNVVLDLVTDEVTREVRASTERVMQDATALAMKDVWSRLYEVTKNMAAALADPDKRFHDTLVSNVKEVCGIMPGLNFMDDPTLTEMIDEVKKTLGKFSPQTLRDDEDKRAATAKRAREIADKMAGFCT